MSIFTNIFKKRETDSVSAQGNVDEYVTLIRVYFQSVMAINMGITNIRFLPDLASFKRTMSLTTQGGRLGVAERAAAKKILVQYYHLPDSFFSEIETSIKKNCKNINHVNTYFIRFQGFSNDLLLLMGNLMQWKFRIPGIFKNLLRSMTEKTVHDICTKNDWKAVDVRKTVTNVQKNKDILGFSEKWIVDFVYNILLLAKKEKRKAE